MRIFSPTISGSLVVSGSITTTGVLSASSFTGDGSGLTGVTSYTDTDTLNFINSIDVLSGSIDWGTLEGKPSGIVSSSAQVSFTTISNKPTLISGSGQISSLGFTTCTGTVTSIIAGTYLTGGTITTTGTIAVDATNVNTASKIVARDASGSFCAATITATCFVETSAQKYKTDIKTFNCTDYFNCLRPVSFKWKENGSEDIGFIAEELNQFYPTLVAKSGEDEPTGVKYTKIVPLLVKKIQEQEERIIQLEKNIHK